jgi:hypothetical protein
VPDQLLTAHVRHLAVGPGEQRTAREAADLLSLEKTIEAKTLSHGGTKKNPGTKIRKT